MDVGARIIIWFDEGPLEGFYITETAIWAVLVSVAIIIFAVMSARKLQRYPKGIQGVAELIVETVYNFVKNNMGKTQTAFAPFIGTLFLYLLVSNTLGLIGIRAVTADMNTTFALGGLVFLVIQGSSIRSRGVIGYMKHFAEPYPFMIPLNILEEVSFPITLSFRLFGNILAGVVVIELVFNGLEYLSMSILNLPIPLLQAVLPLPFNAFFDMFESVLQAFVFSMLTMAFIAKAVTTHEDH